MAKYDHDIAVGFLPQSAEGTYNTTLNAVAGGDTWDGDSDGTDEGLLLGDSESGEGGSGLTFGISRRRRQKPFIAGSFTRPIGDFLAADVSSFQFAFPFCGCRGATTTPTDAEFIPMLGVDAILQAAGMVGNASGANTHHSYKFDQANANLMSGLIFASGARFELIDCRVSSLSINWTPGSVAIATADIVVGSINDPTTNSLTPVALPTLDYGPQATVSAPTIESVTHTWNTARGFTELSLAIAPSIETVPDSNMPDGEIREVSDRETTLDVTLFGDSTSTNETYEITQIFETAASGLDQLSFQVGSAAGATGTATAVKVLVPTPEVTSVTPRKIGSKAASTVSMILGNAAAGEELEIQFL
tara:strand:+ start:2910 stop:3992 length:1083 start_codon:yes stop_codon:yes gene_type:complete